MNKKNNKKNFPYFMPDATRGFIKLTTNDELKKAGVGPMVVNTFHLYLQPGLKVIKKAGGIHKFMNWDGPLLSDSGGFQVFSLIHRSPNMGRIYDDKVVFKSPLDGSSHELTPEKSIQIQFDLGVDMMVCLDDCPPNDFDRAQIEASIARTISWAKRCKIEYEKQLNKKAKKQKSKKPLLFGVIQGGIYSDLRQKCAEELFKIGFDGYGFGARPVDKDGKFLFEVLDFTAKLIPDNKLKFALGIGLPEDIIRCAAMGWQMFDCVIPTREGRHGRLFIWKSNFPVSDEEACLSGRQGRGVVLNKKFPKFYNTINITNAKFTNDFSPINPDSKIKELREYTKAYLHHLFKLKEPLGAKLASLNNLEFYIDLMKKIRQNKS